MKTKLLFASAWAPVEAGIQPKRQIALQVKVP